MNHPCEANQGPVEMETALTLLYDRSRPALRTIANHWIRRCGIGDRVAPDDLLGTAMLALLRNPMRIEQFELTEMAAYLSTVLKNEAFMILRKKQAEQRALRTRMRGLRQTNGGIQELDPAATTCWNERLESIYEQLTGEERMLGMYRRAGYPWSEIARLMNSSPGPAPKTLRTRHPPRERTAGSMISSHRSPRQLVSDQEPAAYPGAVAACDPVFSVFSGVACQIILRKAIYL